MRKGQQIWAKQRFSCATVWVGDYWVYAEESETSGVCAVVGEVHREVQIAIGAVAI